MQFYLVWSTMKRIHEKFWSRRTRGKIMMCTTTGSPPKAYLFLFHHKRDSDRYPFPRQNQSAIKVTIENELKSTRSIYTCRLHSRSQESLCGPCHFSEGLGYMSRGTTKYHSNIIRSCNADTAARVIAIYVKTYDLTPRDDFTRGSKHVICNSLPAVSYSRVGTYNFSY